MKKTSGFRHTIDTLFALVLFCVFAVTTMYVSISGAVAYKNAVEQEESRFEQFTALHYITTKIRNNPDASVSVTEMSGTPVLSLEQSDGSSIYCTYIYCYFGMVKELYFEKGTTLTPESGEDIVAAVSLEFDFPTENIVRITQKNTDGKTSSAFCSYSGGTVVV